MARRKDPGSDPAGPIPYGAWERRTDRRTGERDGRRNIPSLAEVRALVEAEDMGPRPMPTPHLEMLFSRSRDAMEHERLWFANETASLRPQLAQAAAHLNAARSAVEPADIARKTAREELTDTDFAARNYAEQLHNEEFLKRRRIAERQARIERAEAEYQRRLLELAATEQQWADVNEQVEGRLAIARGRALRISAYLSARAATYWEGLCLTHRDGRHLAPLLPYLAPHLPAWVLPPEDPLPPAQAATPASSTPDAGGS